MTNVNTIQPIVEYRVRYRRTGWTRSAGAKLVKFHRRELADAYAQKLQSGGRPDLSQLEYVYVECREVTGWEEVEDQ